MLALCSGINAHADFKLHAIDVGEGDATLVQSAGESLLIDAGTAIGGARIVRYLEKRRINNLGSVVLTHPHSDHIGGVFAILGLLPVKHLYDNGQSIEEIAQREDLFRWYTQAVRNDKRYERAIQGQSFAVGDARIDVLWPPPDREASTDWNNNSLVLRVSYGSFAALIMGDALSEAEHALLKGNHDALRASVLRVGHHGSKFASGDQFLKVVAPKLALVSVDAGNVRGYPAQATLSRLGRVARTLLTSQVGTIVLTAKRDGTFTVETEKNHS